MSIVIGRDGQVLISPLDAITTSDRIKAIYDGTLANAAQQVTLANTNARSTDRPFNVVAAVTAYAQAAAQADLAHALGLSGYGHDFQALSHDAMRTGSRLETQAALEIMAAATRRDMTGQPQREWGD